VLAPTTVVTPLRTPEETARELKPAQTGGASPAEARDPARQMGARIQADRGAGPPVPHLAVFLPLDSEALGPLANALRLGLVAAADAAGQEGLPVRVHALAEDRVPDDACTRARADQAVLVMGGITRSGAAALAASACAGKPALALNDTGDGPLPPLLVSLSLSAEAEARQAAALALADGWRSVAVLMGPAPLDRRLADAFERDWARAGGEAVRLPFSGNADDAPALRERLAKLSLEAVFLALDTEAARAARPYISGSLAAYATSHGIDARAEAAVNVDLEGVRYVDMPWFVQPDHVAVMAYPAPLSSLSPEQERLYALGIDAYRVGLVVARGEGGETVVDGVTGGLRIGPDRRVVRTLVPTRVDAGRVVPLKPPR
jgi:outer membrane PBP1 activator LpoA protein